MQKTIAYQGAEASFSEMAIKQHFGSEMHRIGKISFEEVFESLMRQGVDLALLPIENSLIGPIFENLDLIASHEVTAIGEICLPIEHCLVGRKGQCLKAIEKVYSHPKALAQCTGFFKEHPWIEPIAHFDTAGAVRDIALKNKADIAAIASQRTAEVYNLEILKYRLEDDQSNTTRFLILKRREEGKTWPSSEKCSVLFTLNHTVGSLAAVLESLAKKGANLTQIVSRPIKGKPFEYLFFIDILSELSGEEINKLLESTTQTFKILGIYEPAEN